jgi:hypothetical protein
MKKLIFTVALLFFIILCIEITFRVYHRVVFSSWNTEQKELLLTKYPILHKLDSYSYQEGQKNLLVLGGSVVFEDTVPLFIKDEYYTISMCGLKDLGSSFNVLNLAFPGHTSLDSRFKMAIAQEFKFDYVFIYHGINDVRSNNVRLKDYKIDYKHIQFYDELWTIYAHKESKYLISPLYLELLSKRILAYLDLREYIHKEFLSFLVNEDKDLIDKYFNLPCIRPSIISFQRNLNSILEMAFNHGIQPVLCTYAFYQPDNYSYTSFMKGELDYTGKLFPTELYGPPSCIPYGIKGHNQVIRKTAKKHANRLKFLNFEKILTKTGDNFTDICHLSIDGCIQLQTALSGIFFEK